jgi:hypothetical protein
MSDELSLPQIFPIGTILFETLFLLLAITIESYVLNRRLKFDKKTSIFYAIAMNVFSAVLGWNIFFMLEPILPTQTKSELISYVLFNNFKNPSTQNYVIFLCFIIFLATFLAKLILLKFLMVALDELVKKEEEILISQKERVVIYEKSKLRNTNLVTTTLIANSMSYTAVTLILLTRNLFVIIK